MIKLTIIAFVELVKGQNKKNSTTKQYPVLSVLNTILFDKQILMLIFFFLRINSFHKIFLHKITFKDFITILEP